MKTLKRLDGSIIFECKEKDFIKTLEKNKANLSGADLDFSCLPLWCGSLDMIIDERLAKQIFFHAFSIGKKFWPDELTENQKSFLNGFHRVKNKEVKSLH